MICKWFTKFHGIKYSSIFLSCGAEEEKNMGNEMLTLRHEHSFKAFNMIMMMMMTTPKTMTTSTTILNFTFSGVLLNCFMKRIGPYQFFLPYIWCVNIFTDNLVAREHRNLIFMLTFFFFYSVVVRNILTLAFEKNNNNNKQTNNRFDISYYPNTLLLIESVLFLSHIVF